MEKLTEFVTNSFVETKEIKFLSKSSPKSEPLSPTRSHANGGNFSGSGSDMEFDDEDQDLSLTNNNEEFKPKIEKCKSFNLLISMQHVTT